MRTRLEGQRATLSSTARHGEHDLAVGQLRLRIIFPFDVGTQEARES